MWLCIKLLYLCNNVINIVIFATLFVCIDDCYALKNYLMDIVEILYGNACLPWYLLVKIVPKSKPLVTSHLQELYLTDNYYNCLHFNPLPYLNRALCVAEWLFDWYLVFETSMVCLNIFDQITADLLVRSFSLLITSSHILWIR